MASNERSLGWNTGTSNDGASTYDSSRMIAMENKTLGSGTLITGGLLALSGTGTSTLTIADGAALINGYFYETTTASTIAGPAAGTYILALISNNSGGSYTVTASAAGTTTVLDKTVRMALALQTQLNTIGAANYIAYASVVVNASAQFTTISSYYPFAQTRQIPQQQYLYMRGGTASLTLASTYYDLTSFSSPVTPSTDGTMSVNTTTGAITIRQSGVYTFSFLMKFDSNTTGTRKALLRNLDYDFQIASAAVLPLSGDSVYQASITLPISVTLGSANTYYLQAWASTAGRSVNDSQLTVIRA
jgi:hypothetical protein